MKLQPKGRLYAPKTGGLGKLSRHMSMAAILLCSSAPAAYANPEGGEVAAGNATISQTGKKLDIHQSTDKVIIDWRSFDIGVDEHTQFHQPNSGSTAINRVNNSDPSQILGKLTANGNVVLINPNGIRFGAGSVVDVNGLVATTADIDNDHFMNSTGKLKFNKAGNPNARIINEGTITAKDAGLVGLVAPNVENHGVIAAKLGKVELASGDTFTLDLYGDGLMEVEVSDAVKSQLVSNTGSITAEGGTIALTAAAGRDMVNSLITVEGELKAPAVAQKNGKIIIYGEGSNAVKGNVKANKGKKQGSSTVLTANAVIDASGRNEGEKGGSIEILGDNIGILNGTVIDASGYEGGGDIKVGGDYLGTGDTAAAVNLFVDKFTLTLNDAINSGDGGRTIFWSDDITRFYGNVFGRGGLLGGDGGFVETSGKIFLDAKGHVDLTARSETGNKGTYLLDPDTITIIGNATSVFSSGDLVGHWDFEEGAGATAGDSSGNSNDGTITNATWSVDNAPTPQGNSGSLSFDGNGDYVSIADSNSLDITDDFTISLWMKSNGAQSNRYLLSKRNDAGSDNVYAMLYGYGTDQAQFYGGSGHSYGYNDTNSDINVDDTSWHLVTYTYDGSTYSGYKDGVLVNSVNVTDDVTASTNNLLLGTFNAAGYWFDGLMDDVRIYDTALSATNVAELSGSTFTVSNLETMSATADIVLQATNTIDLDLQGDSLNLSDDRSISLTTTNGDISTLSAGSIVTNRTGAGGNITFTAGDDINIDHALTMNAQNGGVVTMNAADDIAFSTGADITTAGNIVLNSDSDANSDGAISLTGVDFTSNGGNITLGGGANPLTDKAHGNATYAHGVTLSGTTLASAAGNITINGEGDDAGSSNYGVYFTGTSSAAATTGDVTISGTGGNGTSNNFGVNISGNNAGANRDVTSVDGDVTITGIGGGSGTRNYGVYVNNRGSVSSTGTGASAGTVTINGTGSNGSLWNYGIHLHGDSTDNHSEVNSIDGNIILTGNGNGSSGANHGIFLDSKAEIKSLGTDSDAATITINGTGGTNELGAGFYTTGTSKVSSGYGDISITGQGNNNSKQNYGVHIAGLSKIESTGTGADAADITIIGNAGGTTIDNYGVFIDGNDNDANNEITTIDGDISVTGTGANGTTGNHGIYMMNRAGISSTGSGAGAGTITLDGTGGDGTGTNYGVYIYGDDVSTNTDISSDAGNISITGAGGDGGSDNYGVFLTGTAAVASTTGDIDIDGQGGTGADYNHGVYIFGNGATSNKDVTSVDGDITITGVGGNGTGEENKGIFAYRGARIQSTGTGANAGTITLDGTGGNGTTENYGVDIAVANGKVSYVLSVDGDIDITGVGGNGSSTNNHGIVSNYSQIISSGTTSDAANINIDGTAGSTGTGSSYGVFLNGNYSNFNNIETNKGDVTVTGMGGGTGFWNVGVYITARHYIQSFGTGADAGTITIDGTGGSGGNSQLHGVYFLNGATLKSVDGDVSVTGTAGKSNSFGVNFYGQSQPIVNLTGDADASFTSTNSSFSTTNTNTFETNRNVDGGNITFTTQGGNDLNLDQVEFTQTGGGVINLVSAGDVDFSADTSINLGTVSGDSIQIQTTGATNDITLDGNVTATDAGNSLVIASGRNFINNVGASVLNAGAGRWLVYSASPNDNTLNGLSADFGKYNSTFAGYGPGSVVEADNGLLYSIGGILRFTADSLARAYGNANPALTYSFWCSDGCTEAASVTGTPSITTAANVNSDLGDYTITAAAGTLAKTGGFATYDFEFVDGVLTVNEAILQSLPSTVEINSQLPSNDTGNAPEINSFTENNTEVEAELEVEVEVQTETNQTSSDDENTSSESNDDQQELVSSDNTKSKNSTKSTKLFNGLLTIHKDLAKLLGLSTNNS